MFQHTAARRRLVGGQLLTFCRIVGFNTQPPEGGWLATSALRQHHSMFQHTAARRRLIRYTRPTWLFLVSTHSRPKAAEKIGG